MENSMVPVVIKGEIVPSFNENILRTAHVVKAYISRKGFWQRSISEQEKILKELLTNINTIWNSSMTLSVLLSDNIYIFTGGGTYCPSTKHITLYKISLMTFLHEVFHGLCGPSEETARLWSHKVFSMALPRTYKSGVIHGRFVHTVDVEAIQI